MFALQYPNSDGPQDMPWALPPVMGYPMGHGTCGCVVAVAVVVAVAAVAVAAAALWVLWLRGHCGWAVAVAVPALWSCVF